MRGAGHGCVPLAKRVWPVAAARIGHNGGRVGQSGRVARGIVYPIHNTFVTGSVFPGRWRSSSLIGFRVRCASKGEVPSRGFRMCLPISDADSAEVVAPSDLQFRS